MTKKKDDVLLLIEIIENGIEIYQYENTDWIFKYNDKYYKISTNNITVEEIIEQSKIEFLNSCDLMFQNGEFLGKQENDINIISYNDEVYLLDFQNFIITQED